MKNDKVQSLEDLIEIGFNVCINNHPIEEHIAFLSAGMLFCLMILKATRDQGGNIKSEKHGKDRI